MPVKIKCQTCGKEFTVIPSVAKTAKYCSRECMAIGKHTGRNIVCDNCGKEFYRRQYHIDRQIERDENAFCCRECEMEYKHKQLFEVRQCEICGKEFECSKKSTQRFCSNKCNAEWQKTLVGELNSSYSQKSIVCDYCGKSYKVKPYIINSREHHFCCTECRQRWYAEIHSQTDEYREMCRKRAAQLLKDNPYISETVPQKAVNQILDMLNIKYTCEKDFTYYAVDNYLDEYNLIIEVMGDYWHTNPLKYNDMNSINDIQKNRIYRDKAKHTFIKNNYGIEILYLWEMDIVKHPELCKKLISSYIDNNGMLKNYHSFNYHLNQANILTMNDDIIFPYFETN